jgi:peptidyl-prolyl cis-trans isomerase A (cyclophilin A)
MGVPPVRTPGWRAVQTKLGADTLEFILTFNSGGQPSLSCWLSNYSRSHLPTVSFRFAIAALMSCSLTPVLAQSSPAPSPTPNIEDIRTLIQGAIEVTTGTREFTVGHYAVLHSSAGDIVVRLFEETAPKAVRNFIGLSSGQTTWTHPITRVDKNQPLYDGTHFYKVVPDGLIFGGDPINRGEGDPGYSLDHELGAPDDFALPGVLAMQTNGPKSNGSRFFLTLRPFPEWEQRNTAIGRVVAGLDVIQSISRGITKRPTIPLDPDTLLSIEFLKVPEGKMARGSYRLENARPVLTLSRDLVDDPSAVKPASEDPSTTPTDTGTTTTANESITTPTVAAKP